MKKKILAALAGLAGLGLLLLVFFYPQAAGAL